MPLCLIIFKYVTNINFPNQIKAKAPLWDSNVQSFFEYIDEWVSYSIFIISVGNLPCISSASLSTFNIFFYQFSSWQVTNFISNYLK